jgi:hypothetical protein
MRGFLIVPAILLGFVAIVHVPLGLLLIPRWPAMGGLTLVVGAGLGVAAVRLLAWRGGPSMTASSSRPDDRRSRWLEFLASISVVFGTFAAFATIVSLLALKNDRDGWSLFVLVVTIPCALGGGVLCAVLAYVARLSPRSSG